MRVAKEHVIQSLFAGAYIFTVLSAMNSLHSELALASLGASAFIAFSSPEEKASRPRYLIGGYIVGTISGLLCYELSALLDGLLPIPAYIPACAAAAFLTMLLSDVLDFKHPPAVALALAITISSRPVILGVAGLGCVVVLCMLKKILSKHLHNL